MVQGKYQTKPPFPFSPGAEVAGVVKEVGAGVTEFKPGQRVLAFAGVGGYAEEVAVDLWRVRPIPDAMSFETAAGFIITYATSYHALKDRAQLKAGETLLVLGAAGGVGTAAVELGKALGTRVIAAASSSAKLEFARSAGADEVINYSQDSLRDAIKSLTDGHGVDVVYDPVGGDLSLQAFRSLAWHGRHLVVGFAGSEIPAFPANIALLKEASIIGVWWGTWLARHPEEHLANMCELGNWVADGTVQPRVSESFAFGDYRAAFRRIAERQALGKVVLNMGQD
jgi:NADPH2:quinone reductase